MARKIYPYSLDRNDAKVAGVCSTLGGITGVDPTFIRIGFVAAAIFLSFKLTLIAMPRSASTLPCRRRGRPRATGG